MDVVDGKQTIQTLWRPWRACLGEGQVRRSDCPSTTLVRLLSFVFCFPWEKIVAEEIISALVESVLPLLPLLAAGAS